MDLEAIAGVQPPVDERVVQGEVEVYVEHGVMSAEPWRIESVGAADWAMRRLAECEARVIEYQGEVALWESVRDRVARAGEWFEDRLKEWAVSERTEQRKTFPLAHGTVRTSKRQPGIMVTDEDAALAWATSECPDAVKTTTKFLVSEACAKVTECVVAFTSTDKTTGEVERIPVDPSPLDPVRLDALRAKLGDGYVVEPVIDLFVVDTLGRLVPGLAVKPGTVTASVTPLGL